jgi:hypothetical protein
VLRWYKTADGLEMVVVRMLDGSEEIIDPDGDRALQIGDIKEILQCRFGYAKYLQMLFKEDAEAELEDSVAISEPDLRLYLVLHSFQVNMLAEQISIHYEIHYDIDDENRPGSKNCDVLLKLICLGDANSGLTSLITRVAQDCFDECPCGITCGIGAAFKIVNCTRDAAALSDVCIPSFLGADSSKDTQVGIDKQLRAMNSIRVQLWNVPSLAVYRNASGVLAIFDVTSRESFASLEARWKPYIDKHARDDIAIILVGTKADLAGGVGAHSLSAAESAPRTGLAQTESSSTEGWAAELAKLKQMGFGEKDQRSDHATSNINHALPAGPNEGGVTSGGVTTTTSDPTSTLPPAARPELIPTEARPELVPTEARPELVPTEVISVGVSDKDLSQMLAKANGDVAQVVQELMGTGLVQGMEDPADAELSTGALASANTNTDKTGNTDKKRCGGRQVTVEEAEELALKWGAIYVETSAKTGAGMKQAATAITEAALRHNLRFQQEKPADVDIQAGRAFNVVPWALRGWFGQ